MPDQPKPWAGLRKRVREALVAAGYCQPADLAAVSYDTLKDLPGIGGSSAWQVACYCRADGTLLAGMPASGPTPQRSAASASSPSPPLPLEAEAAPIIVSDTADVDVSSADVADPAAVEYVNPCGTMAAGPSCVDDLFALPAEPQPAPKPKRVDKSLGEHISSIREVEDAIETLARESEIGLVEDEQRCEDLEARLEVLAREHLLAQDRLDEKVHRYVLYLRELQAKAAAARDMAAAMSRRAASLDARAASMERYAGICLAASGREQIDTGAHRIYWRAMPDMVGEEIDLDRLRGFMGGAFVRTKVTSNEVPNRKGILDYWRATGTAPSGTTIEQGRREVRIS